MQKFIYNFYRLFVEILDVILYKVEQLKTEGKSHVISITACNGRFTLTKRKRTKF